MYRIRPWLYIGKVRETGDRSIMDAYHIGAILQLAYPATHSGIESLYIEVDDGVPLPPLALQQGIRFAREQKAAGRNLVIGCAYEQIVHVHPEAMPHIEMIKSLGEYNKDTAATKALLSRIWLLD